MQLPPTNPIDISHYKAVHHIGDIQGCYDPLAEYFRLYPMQDDELYIFVGDYMDRGQQNAQVAQWLIENYTRDNIIFLEGNHDRHLRAWAQGGSSGNPQFEHGTRPDLEAAHISRADMLKFISLLRDHYYYIHDSTRVIVSHGGINTLPDMRDSKITSHEYIRGSGDYENSDEIDREFDSSTPDDAYQIHGHRNFNRMQTRINHSCFNLEGRVEFGGQLRTVTLRDGLFEIRNIQSHQDASRLLIVPNHGANPY